jgi:hypothetical protein
MDYIDELIDSAENGDTKSAQTLMEIFHDSFYSNHGSERLLISADGVNYPDTRVLAYMARCMKPIIGGDHKDVSKAFNLTTSQRGRKETKQLGQEKETVWYEVKEVRKIFKREKYKGEPLTRAIEQVAETRCKSVDTVRGYYDEVNLRMNKLWKKFIQNQ